MNELFGIPMDTLLAVLAVMLTAVVGALGLLALRNRVLLKLGVRNVGRRRARSALIVVGLMLGTTIIAAASRPKPPFPTPDGLLRPRPQRLHQRL
jgi:multisubunit Na+/H+ antiporter MnhB subunit